MHTNPTATTEEPTCTECGLRFGTADEYARVYELADIDHSIGGCGCDEHCDHARESGLCPCDFTTRRMPDTAAAALLVLRMLSSLDLTGATAVSDRDGPGVWLVSGPKLREAIVYLHGHGRNPGPYNDFECADDTELAVDSYGQPVFNGPR